ncbi:Uncharacterised protein [Vibrio cholerae]|nr:Uncharacterised protein [Vibrio cholerae]CSD98156.1 Uncharacterised protein [Vibrio cholerae]CSI53491.1 Uncharacterised protein [Vibrio cholerae]
MTVKQVKLRWRLMRSSTRKTLVFTLSMLLSARKRQPLRT